MGWQVFILEILKTTDLMTIMGMSIIGFIFYDRATRGFREQINKSESNLKEYIDATIKPIREQVYNHIPTQMKSMEDKFDRKFDNFDRKFDELFI